ncbi:methylmalonyl-CoA mutase family protein [Neolewinella antarctica]|uniref:Methylmalonyl-CoA mutase alpha/beta chain catalytic domain-containing protein n=1 Tax=Neolewinella antarctica TaxID=442734 RepID=A0ABX0XBI5_9BACT|nr:methylmalonyl-CoA mutase family protein [Neolewinella antarctica]NJC26293.1 hypothetical protein [Neolewinella antarctica]
MPNEFQPATKAAWLTRVEKDLKGEALDSLNFTLAGQEFSPFHHPEDQPTAYAPIPGMPAGHRLVGVRIDASGAAEAANKTALDALNKGADLLLFHVPLLEALSKKTRKELLAGILTDIVTIVFTERLFDHPTSPLLFQEGDTYHHDALQGDYADALFAATETYREEGACCPTFHVGCTDDYYLTLASLRAMRLCWWRISESFGKPTNCRLIAHVRPRDFTDSNHNKIAATTQAMSAIVGGADGLVVAPSDGDEDNAFTRRVALNLQHLLEYESHLHGIADAAAGSYFLESLTERLAERIWDQFQSLFSNPLYNN